PRRQAGRAICTPVRLTRRFADRAAPVRGPVAAAGNRPALATPATGRRRRTTDAWRCAPRGRSRHPGPEAMNRRPLAGATDGELAEGDPEVPAPTGARQR